MWKTNYLEIHEKRYKTLKAKGMTGWSDESAIREMYFWLKQSIQRHSQLLPATVLELGCGAGNLSIALAQDGFSVSGIDISPMAIAWANENAQIHNVNVDFREGNVLDLPYMENTYDIVIDGHCLHCIIGPDRHYFLSQAFRVLKPGGIFLVMTMCNDPTDPITRDLFKPDSRVAVMNGIAGRYFGFPEAIIEEITSAGFQILHQQIDLADEEDIQDELIVEATK